MKKIFIVLCLAIATAFADDQAQIKTSFESYLSFFSKPDVQILKTTFTPQYLKKTGGEKKWVKKAQDYSKLYVGVKIAKMELAPHKEKNKMFARFSLKYPNGKEEPLKDNWFIFLKKPKGEWQIDDFFDDFDPKDKNPEGN